MTERELIQQQQELGDSRFLVTRSGKFFSAYGCGAFALARATGYRVMHRQRKGGNFVLTTGFPESHVGKVMEQIIAAGGKIDRQDDSGSFVVERGRRFFRLFRHRRQRSGGVGLHPRKNGGRARPQGQQKFV